MSYNSYHVMGGSSCVVLAPILTGITTFLEDDFENWCTTYYDAPEADYGLVEDTGDDIVDEPLEDA
ncbi:proline-rich receptor-like protein kinase PERK2 [Iris pallida]|uniref:Proline-rich receptor-like protein kinase PERK2 n=1 Tax=Iris pallida TaxID=29817 RepID=A0AAX6HLZ2_IRIPA|nr:proline-rich receptor-like protein kinase PERK2 [Iris pallida]